MMKIFSYNFYVKKPGHLNSLPVTSGQIQEIQIIRNDIMTPTNLMLIPLQWLRWLKVFPVEVVPKIPINQMELNE